MKTEHDVEALLRATLAGRAATVERGPGWTAPRGAAHRRRVWLAVAGAAAAVALVAAGLLLVHRSPRTGNAVRTPTTTPTASMTARTPTTGPTPVPSACTTTLPAAWAAALEHGTVALGGGRTAMPLSVSAEGVLALRDSGPVPGTPRVVVLAAPGHAPQVVFRVADPDTFTVGGAWLTPHYLVVSVGHGVRAAKGAIANQPPPGVVHLYVIDRQTRHRTDLATAGRTSDAAAVFDGAVYWDERPSYSAPNRTVERYDLATGARSVAYRGPATYVVSGAGGMIAYTDAGEQLVVPARLPDAVRAATTASTRVTLATDGSAWAWLAGPHVLGWWRPGAAVRLLTVPGIDAANGDPPVVAGRFVSVGDQLVDVSSGASAPAPREKVGAPITPLFGWAGAFVGEAGTGQGSGYDDGYHYDSPFEVRRVETRTLPQLRC